MPAVKYDVLIEKGATFRLEITYQEDGTPVDLTGMEARMRFRPDYDEPAIAALDADTDNGRIVLGGEAGTIVVTIPAAVTSALTETCRIVYDLELVTEPGSPEQVERILMGKAELSPEVTKADP